MREGEQLSLADEPRGRAYVWPSWITKLIAGENRCWFAAWYKAHHKYLKRPDDPDRAAFFADYTEAHDRIVNRRAAALRGEGWTVKLEADGEFRIRGEKVPADLSGKPDIVAMRSDEALIVDGKAGKPRQSDHWQVLIYVLFLPLDWLKGFPRIRGEVEYRDGIVDVDPLTSEERRRIGSAIQVVGGSKVPDAAPSRNECKFCDVARCPHRAEPGEGSSGGMF